MEEQRNIRLTSVELTALFENYINDSMAVCVLSYMREITKDAEIKVLIAHALDISMQHMETVKRIFSEEQIALPQGFTEKDVNLKAEPLFSDNFCLYYMQHVVKGGLSTYGMLLPQIYRTDLVSFYSKCLMSTVELNRQVTNLLTEKGLAVRPPYIPYPEKVETLHKQSFLFDVFGSKRPLTGAEILQLYTNIQTNKLGKALALAFAQTARSEKVRSYILRGKEISEKHIDIFAAYLQENDLPVPMTWDHEISKTKEAPFSDKLMLYHFALMNYSGIGNYGMAISSCPRSDLVASFSRLLAEVLKYAEDGFNILINEKWMEQPPMAADRDELTKERRETP